MFRRHVIRHLSAYHHGELSPAERRRVETHLQECEKCRKAHDEIRFGARLASTLSPSSAEELTWRELQESHPALPRRRWIPQAVLASAVLATALIAIFFVRSHGPA